MSVTDGVDERIRFLVKRRTKLEANSQLPDPYEGMTPEERRIAEGIWPGMPRRPMTTQETTDLTGVSRRTLERMYQRHQRPRRAKYPGGAVRYESLDVLRLLSGSLARELGDRRDQGGV